MENTPRHNEIKPRFQIHETLPCLKKEIHRVEKMQNMNAQGGGMIQ